MQLPLDQLEALGAEDGLEFLTIWFPLEGEVVPPFSGPDLNGDGLVNVFDLLVFLECWFPASMGNPCP